MNVEAGGFTEQYTRFSGCRRVQILCCGCVEKDYTDPDGNAYEATQTLTGLKTATVTYSFINEGGNYGANSPAKFVAMGGDKISNW